MKVTGGCHCGKITFEAEIDPDTVGICHCTDCQRLTGTAYRAVVATVPGSFALTSGAPRLYVKTAESGRKRVQAFCPDCGSPLYAANADGPPNLSLRLGAVNERAALTPKRQIWCRSALPWAMDLGALARYERGP